MPAQTVKNYLDEKQIRYVTIGHSPAFTAQEIAASAHIKGQELAKTVIVKLDGQMAMVVLPAPRKINLQLLKDVTGCDNVELADEQEFGDWFPNCEVGAMPPFGNLFDMDVYVAEALTEDEHIAFNAGSHTELIRMAYADYEQLVQPKVAAITYGAV